MDSALLATQFAGIAEYLGGAYGDFTYQPASGGDPVTLQGPCTVLRPDDPRLAGSSDRLFALTIPVAALPAALRPGEFLSHATGARAVVRVDHQLYGLVEIVLTA